MRIHRQIFKSIVVLLAVVVSLVGAYIVIDRIVYYFTGTPQLCRAVGRGDLPEVQRLLRLGASPSRWEDNGEDYSAPLDHAIGMKDLRMVRCLVEHGASRHNARTGDDYLNIAAGVGSPEILAYLMQRFPDHDKAELLYYAAGGNYASRYEAGWRLENVEYLLAHGAQAGIDRPIAAGKRAIHVARTPEIAACLLAHGAQLNVRDNLGYTPLHQAAGMGNLPLVKLYIKHGLNVNDKTKDGKSVLWLATYNRQLKVAAYLKAYGAH